MSLKKKKTSTKSTESGWRSINLDSNLMLTRADEFSGLLSFEVADGDMFDKMFGGEIRPEGHEEIAEKVSETIQPKSKSTAKGKGKTSATAPEATPAVGKKRSAAEMASDIEDDVDSTQTISKKGGQSKKQETQPPTKRLAVTTEEGQKKAVKPVLTKADQHTSTKKGSIKAEQVQANAQNESKTTSQNAPKVVDRYQELNQRMLKGERLTKEEQKELLSYITGAGKDNGKANQNNNVKEGSKGENQSKNKNNKKRPQDEESEDSDDELVAYEGDDDLMGDGDDEEDMDGLDEEDEDDLEFESVDSDDDTIPVSEELKRLAKDTKATVTSTSTNNKDDTSSSTLSNTTANTTTEDEEEELDFSPWYQYELHPLLMDGIRALKFTSPTPIQQACILPAYRDYKDVIGAAQTGSGKTLAFALPILQAVLSHRTRVEEKVVSGAIESYRSQGGNDDEIEEDITNEARKLVNRGRADGLTALIMTPTRELALQIVNHINKVAIYAGVKAIATVGGLTTLKQERLLASKPAIVVGTPGRVWELIRSGNETLTKLEKLRFFVLDEADRMVANGHFPQLDSIINFIQSFRGPVIDFGVNQRSNSNTNGEIEEKNHDHVKGKGKQGKKDEEESGEEDNEVDGEEDEEEGQEGEEEGDEDEEEDNDDDSNGTETDIKSMSRSALIRKCAEEGIASVSHSKPRRMQVFLFSATLTIKDEGRLKKYSQKRLKLKQAMNYKKGDKDEGKEEKTSGTAMIAVLAQKLPFHGKPHIVDYSSKLLISPSIEQQYIECVGEDKDDALFAQLLGFEGKAIVFANAVSIVRRLTSILKELKVNAFGLHAQMLQRQRLNILDKFKAATRGQSQDEQNKENLKRHNPFAYSNAPGHVGAGGGAVIVCTDVAARGLDIPNVDLVIHFHLPSTAELYVHRAGRTGRAGKLGKSIALVSEKEYEDFQHLRRVLGPTISETMRVVRLNTHVMKLCHTRVAIAQKIAALLDAESRRRNQRNWVQKQAEAADLDFEDVDVSDAEGGETVHGGESVKRGQGVLVVKRRKHESSDDFAERVQKSKQWSGQISSMRQQLQDLLKKRITARG